jgi:hypothetical protein
MENIKVVEATTEAGFKKILSYTILCLVWDKKLMTLLVWGPKNVKKLASDNS